MSGFPVVPQLAIRRLEHSIGLALPAYETAGSAGMDLRAAVAEGEEIVLKPRQRILVPTVLINLGEEPFHITRGMRVAQAVIVPAPQVQIIETENLTETIRGIKGFGSTGHH